MWCTCQVKDGSLVNDMSTSVTSLASRVSCSSHYSVADHLLVQLVVVCLACFSGIT